MSALAPLAEANGAAAYCCDWRDLVPVVEAAGGCDAMFADTPYSAKTHAGHDDGSASANRILDFAQRGGGQQKDRDYAARKAALGIAHRRELNYPPFTPGDVRAFVDAWHPLIRGWFTTITDHVLAPAWADALDAVGRYVFAPLPFVAPGSRVRLTGDGPSSWTTWIVVARPKSRAFASWGTLRGAYVLPPGANDMHAVNRVGVVGGKPLWLLCEMIKDYSRPNDLIVDATCGAGTTAAAAIRTGRRAIVGDAKREHAEMAARWILDPGPRCPTEREGRQRVLFGARP